MDILAVIIAFGFLYFIKRSLAVFGIEVIAKKDFNVINGYFLWIGVVAGISILLTVMGIVGCSDPDGGKITTSLGGSVFAFTVFAILPFPYVIKKFNDYQEERILDVLYRCPSCNNITGLRVQQSVDGDLFVDHNVTVITGRFEYNNNPLIQMYKSNIKKNIAGTVFIPNSRSAKTIEFSLLLKNDNKLYLSSIEQGQSSVIAKYCSICHVGWGSQLVQFYSSKKSKNKGYLTDYQDKKGL